ncbi:alpha-N-acetylgalactosaminidase isoform X2 [Rhipicephalus microplus]|uniref:alpha-N-acetylgalactosaminidase isoform X2 n=1 Tax=Rhipicephalus microplus TaxID=6941 RepID=UPI003F6D53A5
MQTPSLFSFLFASLLAFFDKPAECLDNGQALTPPMGWMSWERFRCNVDCYKDPDNCLSEKLFMRMADHLADDGYRDAGYVYLVIDDCWSERQRTNDGYLMADLERFPRGLNFLSDYIHSKGLKFGMYTNYGHSTCMGFPGTEDHDMEKDAERFAAWKIDYLKVDGCHTTAKQQSKGYTRFSEYLNKTNRPIVYSCSWPYYDLFLNKVELMIGNFRLTQEQAEVQMALWAILASPLLMSNDLRKIPEAAKKLLQHKEIIAINQDPLGIQGKRVFMDKDVSVWLRPITPVVDGMHSYAIAIVNHNTSYSAQVWLPLDQLGLNYTKGYQFRNVIAMQDLGTYFPHNRHEAGVQSTGVVLLKAVPNRG